MKRKALIVIYIILIFITLKLLYNVLINSILINNYNKGKYSSTQAKMLTFFNFSESYIANYNYGNILYKNGEYEKAIEEYKKSLRGFIPKNKECNIVINYALATCKAISVNEKDQSSINNAIEKYELAIEILTQKGCANKNNDNGHSQKAETLKKDIQKEIERLKKLQKSSNNKNYNNEEEKNKENIDTVEEKIKNIKESAMQEQKRVEDIYKAWEKIDYNRIQKNW